MAKAKHPTKAAVKAAAIAKAKGLPVIPRRFKLIVTCKKCEGTVFIHTDDKGYVCANTECNMVIGDDAEVWPTKPYPV